MACRSGSIDPGLMLELMRQGWTDVQLSNLLQTQSGLRGLSGFSDDMQELRYRQSRDMEVPSWPSMCFGID